MPGTREDATLIIELAKWGAMIGLTEASRKIYADDFDAEAAHPLDAEVQTVLTWHDRDLVYDWLWVAGSWDRVGPAALKAREQAGVPELFANFEELAKGQR